MATAAPASATGTAPETFAAPAWAWQVAWPRITVTIRGVTAVKYRGERLLSTTTAAENTVLAQLAADGAITRVLAVAGADGLAWAAAVASLRERADQITADTANTGVVVPTTAVQLPVVRIGNTTIALLPS